MICSKAPKELLSGLYGEIIFSTAVSKVKSEASNRDTISEEMLPLNFKSNISMLSAP